MVLLGGVEYLTRREVQDCLNVSKQTLIDWMNAGKPPRVFKLGSRVYYRKDEVEALMHEVTPDGVS